VLGSPHRKGSCGGHWEGFPLAGGSAPGQIDFLKNTLGSPPQADWEKSEKYHPDTAEGQLILPGTEG